MAHTDTLREKIPSLSSENCNCLRHTAHCPQVQSFYQQGIWRKEERTLGLPKSLLGMPKINAARLLPERHKVFTALLALSLFVRLAVANPYKQSKHLGIYEQTVFFLQRKLSNLSGIEPIFALWRKGHLFSVSWINNELCPVKLGKPILNSVCTCL